MTTPAAREHSAGGVLVRTTAAGHEVCLIRRSRHGAPCWSLPKGHLEPSEDTPAAACREVAEETGWHGEIVQPLGDIRYAVAGRDGRRIEKQVTFYLMRARTPTGRGVDAQEVDAVRWDPIARALTVVAYEQERALLQTARRLLETMT